MGGGLSGGGLQSKAPVQPHCTGWGWSLARRGGGGRLHRFIIARVFVALQEEMQRGYFDDFRDFRDSQGKVFAAPQRLVAASNVRAAEGQEG